MSDPRQFFGSCANVHASGLHCESIAAHADGPGPVSEHHAWCRASVEGRAEWSGSQGGGIARLVAVRGTIHVKWRAGALDEVEILDGQVTSTAAMRAHLATWQIILSALRREGPRAATAEWLQRYRYGRLAEMPWALLWDWAVRT